MHACSDGPSISFLAGSRLIQTAACTHLWPDVSAYGLMHWYLHHMPAVTATSQERMSLSASALA